MTERPSDPEQSPIPEDIATLYSRAHMQGTRYWDFSASRKEVRGQFRHRMVREQAERPSAPPELAQRQLVEEVHPQVQASPFQPQPRPDPVRAPVPRPAGETAAQPRDTSTRWHALHSVFAQAEESVALPVTPPVSLEQRPPIIAVFSLAGGVGKTCLVATLGRALSALGENVLLADTATCGLLPFYFGSREFKPGVVRTFSPPALPPQGTESDAPVHVLSLEAERYPGDGSEHDPLLGELLHDGRGATRILVDVATASREVTTRLLLLRPLLLVPILPDMSSVASLGLIDGFLSKPARQPGGEGVGGQTFYLLNQFDASSPLHLDLREMLQRQLGDRLLPFVLRRSSAVSEALAEGMTVIDYAPGSAAAEDYWNLAAWLRSVVAPAEAGFGGVRWSER
jgi:cellulose synthase operon protein YhjQ